MIKFGPSGGGDLFAKQGFKRSVEAPAFIKKLELDCYEYSFGQGVRMSAETAKEIGTAFKKEGIEISVHAPYYINLATEEEEKAEKNVNYITSSLEMLNLLSGNRCVFHPGAVMNRDRRTCFEILLKRAGSLLEILYERNLNGNKLCVETMGKKNQIGTVSEIIEVCKMDKMLYPCVDFGHINAREGGILKQKSDFCRLLDELLEGLGFEKVDAMHVHFSKIQFTAMGEVRHLTFADNIFGPSFEPLAEALAEFKLSPYIICESAGTQAEDAQYMKNYYKSIINQ